MDRRDEKLELARRKEDKVTENELLRKKHEQCLTYRKCSVPKRKRQR